MPLATMAAAALAVVPMVERCRAVLARPDGTPAAEASVRLQTSACVSSSDDVRVALRQPGLPDVQDASELRVVPEPAPCARPWRVDVLSSPRAAAGADSRVRLAGAGIVPDGAETPVELMPLPVSGADAVDVAPVVGRPPDAERKLALPCLAATVRDAAPRLPSVSAHEPCSLPSNALAAAVNKLVYDTLAEGGVNVRASKWRRPLVRMLVDGTPGTDFDCVYRLLLRGFGGNDERTKIRALTKWAEANLPPREAADVYRAETRYWLNAGDPAMTADAAGRMERARPDYAVRARRLSALAHAMSGELEKAKAEIARSRAECWLSLRESQELLYLEAWIALQEGDVDLARRNLAVIVAENPRGATARKARRILESISEEAHE